MLKTRRPPDGKRTSADGKTALILDGPYTLPCPQCKAEAGKHCVKVTRGDGAYQTSPSQKKAEMHMPRLDAYNAQLRREKEQPTP